ncbi:MAG TPA: BTAD domain-containing putative transcriptional regulator [Acidimicrobiales bacterium]|nr:BTAD domain-containing putative transcriptional regulator [Acidimicrobiales bacterium]
MRVRVLGPVDAFDGSGSAVAIGSRNQRLVLAVLAAHAGETVSADRLVDALWQDAPPRTASTTLRTYVSRLRHLLGDAVALRPGGYALVVPPGALDSEQFERLVDEARSQAPARRADVIQRALDLWRGPAFGDLADEEHLRGAAIRLEELRYAAREARAAALAAAGRAAEAAAAAEELVVEHPLREGAWAVLVEALTAAHRAPEALRAYQRAAATLAHSGLEPSDRLRRAEAAALAQEAPAPAPRRLPTPASSLVGREGDLVAIDRMVGGSRLVTLTGPGGVGKTRLALEVATRAASKHEWGARLVELARVENGEAVGAAVVDALGLSVEGGSVGATLRRAGTLDLLVVLDNCEHVLDEAASVAEALVTGGEGVRVLATSRERLGAAGERVWPVVTLPLEAPSSPARQLFVERALAVRPDLELSDETLVAADRIVARLDGLPLAIEMAAARAATLPLSQLADWLDSHLGGLRFERGAVAARHRTLAGLVEWSEALSSADDRALFADLSVFVGTADATDIAAVTGRSDVLEALCRLAERSLVVAHPDEPRARFGMLATIRAQAAQRLAVSGKEDVLRRRHAEHFAEVAASADRKLRTPDEGGAHGRLQGVVDELRAAHQWSRTRDLALAARVSSALHLFAQSRLRDEPLGWATALAAGSLDSVPGNVAAAVLASAAQRAVNTGHLGRARQLAERGIAAAGTAPERVYPLEVLADVHLYEGRLEASVAAAGEALAAGRQSADPHCLVASAVGLALPSAYAGRLDAAERALETEVDRRELAPSDRGWLAYAEGEVVLDRDPVRALAALDRAIALADAVGNRYLGGVARVSACSLRARAGDPDEALGAFTSVIEHWRRQSMLKHQLTTLRNLTVLLERIGALPEAAELLGTVQGDAVAPTYGEEAVRLAEIRARVVKVLGDTEGNRRLASGAARTIDDAAVVALDWLGRLHRPVDPVGAS